MITFNNNMIQVQQHQARGSIKGQNVRNSQNKSIGAVPESMLFGDTETSVIEKAEKHTGSADLLHRNSKMFQDHKISHQELPSRANIII